MGLLNNLKQRKKISDIVTQHYAKIIILSFTIGLVWFALLASDVFNNKTYFSENALLPGLVVREFSSRSSVNRLIDSLKDEVQRNPMDLPSAWIQGQFRQLGLDMYRHSFNVTYPMGSHSVQSGYNMFAVLRATKVASTESIVISTPFRNFNSIHEDTLASVALMVELAQLFRRHSYWSKDIIFLITQHENMGFQAWLDAYHDVCTSNYIASEKLRSTSGIIHGVINLEVSSSKFSHIDIKIEGLHGQLPNLDLFNLVAELCSREDVATTFHSQFNHYPSKPITWKNWKHNFKTMSSMVLIQATGLPTGGHGLFHRFGIQALTLKSVTSSSSERNFVTLIHLGRVLEGVVRSLNNLLEKFHQSFFFYLLPSTRSYVSIGLYIPPFSLIALPVLIKALHLYISIQASEPKKELCPRSSRINYYIASDVFTLHVFCGIIMLFLPMYSNYVKDYFTLSTKDLLYYMQLALIFVWFVMTCYFNLKCNPTETDFAFKMCLILLALGGFMFTLALVNVSFALIFAILYVPISVTLSYRGCFSFLQHIYLFLVNPFVFTYLIVVFQSFCNDSKIDWWIHFYRAIQGHKNLILYTIEDMYFFANWNYQIISLIIFPLWFNLWSLKLLRPHQEKNKML